MDKEGALIFCYLLCFGGYTISEPFFLTLWKNLPTQYTCQLWVVAWWDLGVKQLKRSNFLIAILLRVTELNMFLHCRVCLSCVIPNLHNRNTFQVHKKWPFLMNFSFYFIQKFLSLSCVKRGWIFLISMHNCMVSQRTESTYILTNLFVERTRVSLLIS